MFLLDGDGFCRATVPGPTADDAARSLAKRCIDAQYVASLDLTTEGLLVSEPKAGRQMLFAKVNANGKVALIRTGSLLEMRSLDGAMPSMAPPVPEKFALDEDPDEESKPEIEPAKAADKEPSVKTVEAHKAETVEAAHAEPAEVEGQEIRAENAPEIEAEKIPVAEGTDPDSSDECMELTAPFSRELLKASAVMKVTGPLPAPTPPKTAPVLAPLAGDDDDEFTREDFTRVAVDRESQNDNGELAFEVDDDLDNAKTGERTSLLPESRPAVSAGPVTVQAPRTVRGFPPPPPPIPIASRRGILPRRW